MGNILAMTTLGKRLRKSREAKGYSQTRVAKECNVSRAAVSQWEGEDTTPSNDKLQKIALLLGVDFYWLLTGRTAPSISDGDQIEGETVVNGIPVVGTVEAGIWREEDAMDATPTDFLDMPEDVRFPGVARSAVRVRGDSMDLVIPDGGYAVFVQYADYGKNLENGQLVIAERLRHQGGLVERTIKEYRINGCSIELWPRSSNPKHSQPVRLSSEREGEEVEVRIIGVVVAKYVPL